MVMASWKAREHFDNETRESLGNVPDAVREELMRAYEDEWAAIWRKEAEMQEVYKRLPAVLASVSAASGVSQHDLLVICRRIAVTSRTEWYEVLYTIGAYFRVKATLEDK